VAKEESVGAAFVITPDDFADASKMHNSASAGVRRRRIFSAISILIVVLAGAFTIAKSRSPIPASVGSFLLYVAPGLLVVLLLFIVMGSLQKAAIRRQHGRHPDVGKSIGYLINPEGIKLMVDNTSEETNKWRAYSRVVRTPKGFLLYTSSTLGWIPNRAFESQEDAEAAAHLAANYAPRYDVITG